MDELIEHGHFEQAHRVFEFGCGTGRLAEQLLSRYLSSECDYIAVDISPKMVDITQQRLQSWQNRAQVNISDGSVDLDFPEASFDRFISTYVIDLLSETEAHKLVSETHRILKPDGLLGLVSITHGKTLVSKIVMESWRRLGNLSPILVGGCRPIDLMNYLHSDQWAIEYQHITTRFAVAMQVIVARRI